MRQKASLFDFDGMIADTEGEYSKFWEGIGLLTTLPQDCGQAHSGLHFQLVCDEKKAFSGLPAYGKFSGVNAYIVAAGKKAPDLDEQIGYYGEALVLFAQSIGLNSCWAGVSYTKIKDTYILEKDEKIACYIAIGYGETPGIQHKSKALEEISDIKENSPEWYKKGVKAAQLAPTAVNQQKFYIEYLGLKDGDSLPQVKFHKGHSLIGYTQMDCGIARYHFGRRNCALSPCKQCFYLLR